MIYELYICPDYTYISAFDLHRNDEKGVMEEYATLHSSFKPVSDVCCTGWAHKIQLEVSIEL